VTNTTTTNTTTAPLDAVDADYATAWRAADTATADLVRFADVVGAVDAGAASMRDAGAPHHTDRVRYAIADAVASTIVDAVADARDGYEPDAVAVVVVAAGRLDAFWLLQRAGVAAVMRQERLWVAGDGDRPALSFANVAGALAYATGHAAPTPRQRRARASQRK